MHKHFSTEHKQISKSIPKPNYSLQCIVVLLLQEIVLFTCYVAVYVGLSNFNKVNYIMPLKSRKL